MNQDLILQQLKDAVAACRVNPAVQSEENRQILKEFEDLLNDAEYENSRETPLDALDFILSSLGAFSSLLMLANEILRTVTDLEHRYTKSCKPRFKELYSWLDGALDACSDLSGGDEELQMVQEDFLQSLLTVASTALNRRTGKKKRTGTGMTSRHTPSNAAIGEYGSESAGVSASADGGCRSFIER